MTQDVVSQIAQIAHEYIAYLFFCEVIKTVIPTFVIILICGGLFYTVCKVTES